MHITVRDHKTAGATGRPLVVPITGPLLTILQDARRRRPHARFVVTYRGNQIKSIRGGVKAAARAAGLTWGCFDEAGVTFHTMRHTMATLLAELSDADGLPALSESQRKAAMGHQRLETTQRYTHIRPTVERRVLERLGKVAPIVDVVTQARTRASRAPSTPQPELTKPTVGTSTGTREKSSTKTLGIPPLLRRGRGAQSTRRSS